MFIYDKYEHTDIHVVLNRDMLAFLLCINIGMLDLIFLTQVTPHIVADSVLDVNFGLTLPKFFVKHTLSCNSVNLLMSLYLKLNESSFDLLIKSICKRYSHIFLNGYMYKSSGISLNRKSFMLNGI